ncbi:MAG TPA: hypothetical protein VLN56_03910, partial [Gammaproteobacteria bacterium]|nr:hypothetical protein [Gammaproteobacteria bacterium]
ETPYLCICNRRFHMGPMIGGMAFIGGCLILYSLMATTPRIFLLGIGIFLVVLSVVMFIREIRKIG